MIHITEKTTLAIAITLEFAIVAVMAGGADKKPEAQKSNPPAADAPTNSLTKGLVAHWDFDENDGTKVGDKTQEGNAGTIQGGAKWIDGPLKHALSFDGVDDHVTVGNPRALDLPEHMSAFAWIRFENVTAGGNGQCVYGQTNPGGNGGQYELCVGRGKNVNEVTVLWKDVDVCASKSQLKTGQWYHVGFTRTGMRGNWTCTVYIDGVASNVANNIATDVGQPLPFAIGRPGAYNGLYFAGAIDDMRIYNRALSTAEVAALFKVR